MKQENDGQIQPYYLTISMAANLFMVSSKTIKRWIKAGMPFSKKGRTIRIKRIDAIKWYDESVG